MQLRETMSLRQIRGREDSQTFVLLWPLIFIKNSLEHKYLISHLVRKDIKLAYHSTFLGYLWTVIEPLFMTAILYTLFVILRGSSDEFLPLYVMLGILFYSTFSKTTSMCNNVLLDQASLINQVYFPREVFHVNILMYQLYRLCMSLFIIVPMLFWYKITLSFHIFLLIPAMLGIGLLGMGIGMITCVLQVRIRDLKQMVQVGLKSGFYISGVFFGGKHIPPEWLDLYFLNPIAVFIELSRVSVLGEMGVLKFTNVAYALIFSLIVLIAGMCIFKKYEQKVVKYL